LPFQFLTRSLRRLLDARLYVLPDFKPGSEHDAQRSWLLRDGVLAAAEGPVKLSQYNLRYA